MWLSTFPGQVNDQNYPKAKCKVWSRLKAKPGNNRLKLLAAGLPWLRAFGSNSFILKCAPQVRKHELGKHTDRNLAASVVSLHGGPSLGDANPRRDTVQVGQLIDPLCTQRQVFECMFLLLAYYNVLPQVPEPRHIHPNTLLGERNTRGHHLRTVPGGKSTAPSPGARAFHPTARVIWPTRIIGTPGCSGETKQPKPNKRDN